MTLAVGATIFVAAVILLYTGFILLRLREEAFAAAQAPAILTMMGIAGTFFGMVLGLSTFDVQNVQGSVPLLIEGVRTAAWASLIGVVCSIIVKICYAHFRYDLAGDANATDADRIIAKFSEYNERVLEKLSSIQHALVGQDDASITSQLKLLRQDSNDRLKAIADKSDAQTRYMSDKLGALQRNLVGDEATSIIAYLKSMREDANTRLDNLIHAQEAFMKQLAELGSKALVEALNQDFA